jgi:hypothetical protein
MTGIMDIPLKKFCMLAATHTIWKRTHHFEVALKTCCKTAKSFDSIYTFNPFVVGSTPARPTNIIMKKPQCSHCGFFLEA